MLRNLAVFLSFFFLFPSLCSCYVLNARNALIEVRKEIQETKKSDMEETALYHIAVAKGLLADAEKQYEDADFAATVKFARRAQEQLDRARKLQDFHERLRSSKTGGAP